MGGGTASSIFSHILDCANLAHAHGDVERDLDVEIFSHVHDGEASCGTVRQFV